MKKNNMEQLVRIRLYPSIIFCLFIIVVFLLLAYTKLIPENFSLESVRPQIQISQNNSLVFSNFICDYREIDRFPKSSTTPSNDSFDLYRKTYFNQYCDIVPIPRSIWIKPKTYSERDIVFVIFTAASFYHNRATTTRDTWLSRVTNYHFLSSTDYPFLPVTVVKNAGEDKLSNMKKIFYGLQIIYKQQMNLSVEQRQKWFYIAGCDTFILPHHLLKRIDDLDYQKPILLGGHSGHHSCLTNDQSKVTVNFPSGGAGFFISWKLFDMLQPKLTDYVENRWPNNSEISDVALTCLIKEFGITLINKPGFWSHPPMITDRDSRAEFQRNLEPNNYHYVTPDEMYALDEFYVHQHLDRLMLNQNWNEYVQFTRRFVASHYELLRKKRRGCTLPVVGSS